MTKNIDASWKKLPNLDKDCFGCGLENHSGLHMTFETNGEQIRSKINVPQQFRGWSKLVHGGVISTILDETMSWSVIFLLKRFILTKQMTIQFHRPVYVGSSLCGIGSIKEYLNKQKMGGVGEFVDKFGEFAAQLPAGFKYCVEIRNPNYLTNKYFDFLAMTGLHHVFLHGYYMASIFDVYKQFKVKIQSLRVIRLHGGNRKEMEEQTGNDWSQFVAPKDEDLYSLATMLTDLRSRNIETFLYVNNHFEGSAPRTIVRINELLKKKK